MVPDDFHRHGINAEDRFRDIVDFQSERRLHRALRVGRAEAERANREIHIDRRRLKQRRGQKAERETAEKETVHGESGIGFAAESSQKFSKYRRVQEYAYVRMSHYTG